MSEAAAAAVLRKHFSGACPEPLALQPAPGEAINSRNWIVQAGNRRFVLKAGGDGAILPWYPALAARSPLLPRLLGHAVEGGVLHRLIEFREGEPGAGSAAAAGRALAELHLALRGVPGEQPFSARYAPLPNPSNAMKELPAWYAEIAALEARAGLPRAWVHHDCHPGNVLFRDAAVTAILDMDSLGTDFRMQAAAFAASRFGSPAQFLDAYAAVDPLTPEERASYAPFVRRAAVRRINFILRDATGAWRRDLPKHLATIRDSYANAA